MMDGIIKADGTSRLARSVADFKTRYPTYDAFAEALMAGTLPLDILFNAAGWSQFPDFLNKANLLRDSAAAKFGMASDAVPNDIFSYLGNYALHWWSRDGAIPATFFLGEEDTAMVAVQYNNVTTIYYSDSVNISDDGVVTLAEPISSFTGIGHEPESDYQEEAYGGELEKLDAIKGKYFYRSSNTDIIYYRTSTTDASFIWGDSVSTRGSLISAQRVYGVAATVAGEKSYVCSGDRSAYPDSGTVDGVEYEYLGIPFENAVTAPKIATGSYKGTGTFGSTNQNSLSFDHTVKLVLIYGETSTTYSTTYQSAILIPVMGLSASAASTAASISDFAHPLVTVSGNTWSWYAGDAATQCNNSGTTYNYIAIG